MVGIPSSEKMIGAETEPGVGNQNCSFPCSQNKSENREKEEKENMRMIQMSTKILHSEIIIITSTLFIFWIIHQNMQYMKWAGKSLMYYGDSRCKTGGDRGLKTIIMMWCKKRDGVRDRKKEEEKRIFTPYEGLDHTAGHILWNEMPPRFDDSIVDSLYGGDDVMMMPAVCDSDPQAVYDW